MIEEATGKVCRKCGEWYPLEQLTKHKKCKYGRDAFCKPCASKKSNRYNKANRESRTEYMRKWVQNNKDKVKVTDSRRYTKHRTERNERSSRRRAKTSTEVDYVAIKLRDTTCYICGQRIGDDYHFDHVVPLSKGGTHSADNVRLTHSVCNLRKRNKLLEELVEYDKRGPDVLAKRVDTDTAEGRRQTA